jgi:sugar/nucleoside kinase (ribokinase family)
MEKLYDVLVVGELNVDLILDEIEKFPEVGKEVLAQKMTLTLGSSSAIFASNISSLGARVAFIGKIGKDKFGEVVLESLQKNKVDISMIKVDGHSGNRRYSGFKCGRGQGKYNLPRGNGLPDD